jgi:hypothetical protein
MLVVPEQVCASPRAYLTPTLFVQGRKCLARLAWASSDAALLIPKDPSAILGTALHRVQEQADRGELSGQGGTFADTARAAFDQAATEALTRAHPLVRARYPQLHDLPRFYLQRARSVEMALEHVPAPTPPHETTVGGNGPSHRPIVEASLKSSDGLLRGRADCLDVAGQKIVDYKSGSRSTDGSTVSEEEELQLLFYAALARDNGVTVREGCIVRSDGRRATCSLPAEAAEAVAGAARMLLAEFNTKITSDLSPDAMAAPSPAACARCGFRAICSAFWREATPDWAAQVGSHAEIHVQDVRQLGPSRSPSIQVSGKITAGSVTPSGVTAQFPLDWVGVSFNPALLAGGQIRLLNVREQEASGERRLLGDRERGFVWLLPNRVNAD